MKKLTLAASLIPVMLCLLAVGLAIATPIDQLPGGGGPPPGLAARVTVDNEDYDIPFGLLLVTSTGFTLPNPITQKFGLNEVTISQVSGQFDPVLNFAVAFTDAYAPSSFMFSIFSPLNPGLTHAVDYRIDFLGSFTDGSDNGGSLTPFSATFGAMDVSLDDIRIDGIGTTVNFSGPANFYGPFMKTGAYVGGSPPYELFGITMGLTGSGGNDTYALNGRFEVVVTSVPEPSALLILGVGLIGLAALSGRKFFK